MHRIQSLLLLISFLIVAAAQAAIIPPVPRPPSIDAKSWILIDNTSGRVLGSRNADQRLEPASLTKLMTGYAVFHALKEGKLKLHGEIPISEYAWRVGGAASGGSTTFAQVGSRLPVEVLVQGMIVQSGNDASIALAEAVAGSEATFAELMNGYAAALGMNGSHFQNSTGLPGDQHYTTAQDMARLARAIVREFPEYYKWYSQKDFTWNGITQHNRNGLLYRDPAVDGMKTGHTESAGYCLVSSARRDGMRLISVVMGMKSPKAREDASMSLLNYGFGFYETRRVYAGGRELAKPRVFGAPDGRAAVGLRREFALTLPRGRYADVKTTLTLKPDLEAPIAANQAVGSVRAVLDGKVIGEQPLYPLAAVEKGNVFRRMWDTVASWFG
jgi:serine-type D-Ala-D-Ala carboxypeptidase (penicillin-binding protein 5/6)